MIGLRFGRYRVEEELGRGDFGVTCRGVDVESGGPDLALKIAHAHLRQDDLFMALLERECAPLRDLTHPGIAGFQGLIGESGHLVAARDLVAGEDLRRVLARGRLPVQHVVGVLELILRALAHAHQRRVIHGDLGPTNIFWCYDGGLRLTDFGLARAVHVAEATRTGSPSGHPDYMAPELSDGQLSARSDLYTLGLIAFECLVGHPACEPGDAAAKLSWHRYKGMADPRNEQPDCPDWLARLLLQFSAIDPATRPADAHAALAFVRPSAAPVVGGAGPAATTEITSDPSGLTPPPPPERTPPAPPRLDRPTLDDTVSATAPQGFGTAGLGASDGFGGGFGHAAAPRDGVPPLTAPVPPAAHAGAVTPAGLGGTPAGPTVSPSSPARASRNLASASDRGVDRRLDPVSIQEKEIRAKRERIRVAVFWSVTIGVLLVSVVAFVGYRAMEARRLVAARATGPDIDPELLIGGGFDRFEQAETEDQPRGGSKRGVAAPDDPTANDPQGGAGTNPGVAAGADERYLLGGGDEQANEYSSLSVSSNPIGARVWLNNDEIGYTPLEGFSLREGNHVVRIELDGYGWASRKVEVQRGVPVDLGSVVLDREVVAAGPVLLWSVELEGANVFVDGTHAGRMPVVMEMTPGEHTFFVQPAKGEPVELSLTAYPGTDAEPGRLQLEPR